MKNASLFLVLAAGMLAACSVFSDLRPNPPAVVSSTAAPIPTASATAPPAKTPEPAGRLVYSVERSGRWDLVAAEPAGSARQWLTNDGQSVAPAISRDGSMVALASHRDGNWEIYTINSDGSRLARLTRDLAFAGQPSWSPDGSQIAFASTRQDDLDIWTMRSDGTNPVDLTRDSPAVDDNPAWSPDGRWIAFTSWRSGQAQLFLVSPDGKQTLNLSQNKSNDQMPAWSPDGRKLAFVSDRDGQRAIYVADFGGKELQNPRRLTFSGWDVSPVWSPDGQFLAFISPRPAKQTAYVVPAAGGLPRALDDSSNDVQSVAWQRAAAPLVDNSSSDPVAPPLYAPPAPGTAAKLVPMKDVYLAPSYGEMSDRAAGSYQALRAKVKAEAGWDFLSVLSDMARQLSGGVCGDGCEILSWHKTGRAVDTRLAVTTAGVSMIEIVREEMLGETYWRVYLRAAKQDGTEGQPLTEAPWDWSNNARWTLAPHQGGVPETIPTGYYVDFTELAREYGWNRISSYDDPSLSWKENKLGMEFWHFQMTGGLVWYDAERELYSSETLESAFDWNDMLRQKQDEYLLPLKGVPAPPSAWRWFALPP